MVCEHGNHVMTICTCPHLQGGHLGQNKCELPVKLCRQVGIDPPSLSSGTNHCCTRIAWYVELLVGQLGAAADLLCLHTWLEVQQSFWRTAEDERESKIGF